MTEEEQRERPEYIEGSFAFVPLWQLFAPVYLGNRGELSPLALRVWFSFLEMLEVRRFVKRRGEKAQAGNSAKREEAPSCFTLEELRQKLRTRASTSRVQAALAQLRAVGLLKVFEEGPLVLAPRLSSLTLPEETLTQLEGALRSVPNHKRRVPVPRRVLHCLGRKQGTAASTWAVAVLIRCVYRENKLFNHIGRIRDQWVVETLGGDYSNLRRAREWFVKEGWVEEQPYPEEHWKVGKKYGARYRVNLFWYPSSLKEKRTRSDGTPKKTARHRPVSSRSDTRSTSIYKETSSPSEKKKTKRLSQVAGEGTGSSSKGEGRTPTPSWNQITPEDLRDEQKVKELYSLAVSLGHLSRSLQDRFRFFIAVERALALGRSPGAFLRTVVEEKRWYGNLEFEARATRRLKSLEGMLSSGESNDVKGRVTFQVVGEASGAPGKTGLTVRRVLGKREVNPSPKPSSPARAASSPPQSPLQFKAALESACAESPKLSRALHAFGQLSEHEQYRVRKRLYGEQPQFLVPVMERTRSEFGEDGVLFLTVLSEASWFTESGGRWTETGEVGASSTAASVDTGNSVTQHVISSVGKRARKHLGRGAEGGRSTHFNAQV